jgi:hypothetical protein
VAGLSVMLDLDAVHASSCKVDWDLFVVLLTLRSVDLSLIFLSTRIIHGPNTTTKPNASIT